MSCNHRQHQSESNEIIYLKNSLLKYEPPHLIIQHDIPKKDSRKICRTTIPTIYSDNLSLLDPYSDSCRSEDILDLIFPPVEVFNKTNHKYVKITARLYRISTSQNPSRTFLKHDNRKFHTLNYSPPHHSKMNFNFPNFLNLDHMCFTSSSNKTRCL